MPNGRNAFVLFRPVGQQEMSKNTTSKPTPRSMSPEAIEEAAWADRDAQPLSQADLKRMKRTPQAKIILGTLRDWEQGRAEPDQPTRAYLTVIARDADRVNRILNSKPL